MSQENKGDFEMNYVYKPAQTDEFRSVNVILKVMNRKVNLNIYSDDEIEIEDLKPIVAELQKKINNRTGIDIQSECSIYLFVKDSEYYIEYDKNIKIYGLLNKG